MLRFCMIAATPSILWVYSRPLGVPLVATAALSNLLVRLCDWHCSQMCLCTDSHAHTHTYRHTQTQTHTHTLLTHCPDRVSLGMAPAAVVLAWAMKVGYSDPPGQQTVLGQEGSDSKWAHWEPSRQRRNSVSLILNSYIAMNTFTFNKVKKLHFDLILVAEISISLKLIILRFHVMVNKCITIILGV